MTTPEFSRPVRLDTLGGLPRTIRIEPTEAERLALAARFGLISLDRLEAEARLARSGERVEATGTLHATIVQCCAVTEAPLQQTVEAAFQLRFVPEATLAIAEEEVELAPGDLDTLGYAGGAIDLGEAVAQELALALDPFPRSPAADAALAEAGVLGEGEAGAFGGLAALRAKLGR